VIRDKCCEYGDRRGDDAKTLLGLVQERDDKDMPWGACQLGVSGARGRTYKIRPALAVALAVSRVELLL